MLEDEGDTGIPHFVTDNISRLYSVDPKEINCAMLLRDNKSLASAILDIGEQMQKMEQMLRDFCQNYGPINNPQSEVETKIHEFLTGATNVCQGTGVLRGSLTFKSTFFIIHFREKCSKQYMKNTF